MPRLVRLLAAAVLVALAVWLLLPRQEADDPPPAPPPPTPDPVAPAAPEVPPDEPAAADAPADPPTTEGPADRPASGGRAALEGIVLDDSTGERLPGARVRITRGGTKDGYVDLPIDTRPLGESTTDAEGRFRIDGIEPGVLVTVAADAPGHSRATRSLVVDAEPTAAGRVELRLSRAGSVSGVVRLPDGRPAAGARVYVLPGDAPESLLEDPGGSASDSSGRSWAALEATAGEDGAFEVRGIELGAVYSLRAILGGRGRSEVHTGVAPTADDPAPVVDLVVRENAALTVRVVDPDGKPAEGAKLFLFGKGFPIVLESAVPGKYVAAPPPGDYTLRVTCPGSVRQEMPVPLAAGETREIEVRLDGGVALAGVLTDDAGAPIANQKIFVSRPWQLAGKIEPSEGKTTTDARGRFRIEGLRPGVHTLGLFLGKQRVPDDLRLTAPAEDLVIRLPRMAAVRAVLRLPPGGTEPETVGLRVEMEADGGWQSSGRSVAFRDGSVTIGKLAPGEVRLRFQAEGYAETVRDVTLAPGATLDLGEIALDRGVALAARVVDREGRPIAGAEVSAGMTWTPSHRTVTTDREGRFVLEALPRGEIEIEVRAEGYLPTPASVVLPTENAGFTVVLDTGGLLAIRVVDAAGKPAPGARVRWSRTGSEESDAEETDHRGSLEVRLAEGKWTVETLDEDWEPVTSREVDVVEGGRATVTLPAVP